MKRLAKRFTWLAIGAISLTGAAAYAGQITLYEDHNFQGRYLTTTDSVSNLQRTDFNDTASSIVVTDGVWEACSSAYFHGRCVQLAPGSYSELRGNLDDRISSVRQVADSVAPFPRPDLAAVAPRIVLYQHTLRGTKSVELTYSVHELDNVDFNNRADAAVVRRVATTRWVRSTGVSAPPNSWPARRHRGRPEKRCRSRFRREPSDGWSSTSFRTSADVG